MYLLAAALVSVSAHADPLLIGLPHGGCSTRPPPCLGIQMGGDGTILPPDWYERAYAALDGNLNWLRVAVSHEYGSYGLRFGDFVLDERWAVREESDERTTVYYVPASAGMIVAARGDRDALFVLEIEGAEKAPF